MAALGLLDLGEALVSAGRNDRLRPLMRRTWGRLPFLNLCFLATLAGMGGVVLGGVLPPVPFLRPGVWPVLLFAVPTGLRIRAAMRADHADILATPGRSFRALALPLVPAAAVLAASSTLAPFAIPAHWPGAAAIAFESERGLVGVALALAQSWLVRGVGLAVTVATLAGRRQWLGSLFEIGWRYFVFRIMLVVSHLVLDVMGGVLWGFVVSVARSLIGWRIPLSWKRVFEQVVEHGFELLVFLGLLGVAWVAAERCFQRLMLTGDVHYLRFLGGLVGNESKPAKESVDPTWPGVNLEEAES